MANILKSAKAHPTLLFALLCGLGVLVVFSVIGNTKSSAPTSLAAVKSEVQEGIDAISERLPPTSVVATSQSEEREPCTDGTNGQQVLVTRTIELAPTFDEFDWTTALREKYDSTDGWTASMKTLSSADHLSLTIVGRALIIYKIATGSPDAQDQMTIRATSRCSST